MENRETWCIYKTPRNAVNAFKLQPSTYHFQQQVGVWSMTLPQIICLLEGLCVRLIVMIMSGCQVMKEILVTQHCIIASLKSLTTSHVKWPLPLSGDLFWLQCWPLLGPLGSGGSWPWEGAADALGNHAYNQNILCVWQAKMLTEADMISP